MSQPVYLHLLLRGFTSIRIDGAGEFCGKLQNRMQSDPTDWSRNLATCMSLANQLRRQLRSCMQHSRSTPGESRPQSLGGSLSLVLLSLSADSDHAGLQDARAQRAAYRQSAELCHSFWLRDNSIQFAD
jgi:hypothetical protein